jgi:hypothetical protein
MVSFLALHQTLSLEGHCLTIYHVLLTSLNRDAFYEKIPISLLHHTNGNGIYNTSHPLLERLVGQLEVEAPCPYNSIPYDYRMSQMWVEGESDGRAHKVMKCDFMDLPMLT